MNETLQKKIRIQLELRKALNEGDQFYLLYQPQYSLKEKKIVGVEALLRWNHPTLGLISPADFIPIAEESGLIKPLGDWVILEACQQVREWTRNGLDRIRMSVNISAIQFESHDLVHVIDQAIQQTEMDPTYLTVEITESVYMEKMEHTQQILKQLQDLGITAALDDFGTGYSSLSYLKDLSIDHLKIDASFIRKITEQGAGMAVVKSMIDLANNMGLGVIAEGVEKQEEIQWLDTAGCHEVQGYYFSRPVAPEEIERLLRKENKE